VTILLLQTSQHGFHLLGELTRAANLSEHPVNDDVARKTKSYINGIIFRSKHHILD